MTATAQKTNVKDLPLGSIASFPGEDNVSRVTLFANDEDRFALAALLSEGYMIERGGPIGVIDLSQDKAKQQLAVDRLTVEWNRLKAVPSSEEHELTVPDGKRVTVTGNDVLNAFEAMHVKGGKIITPLWGANWGHRRTNSVVMANAIRARLSVEPITTFPCVIRDYETDLDRHIACINENLGKTAGSRALGDVDKFRACQVLFQNQAREKDFVAAGLKRGAAQQMHRLLKLDAALPEAKIGERIIGGDYDLKKFDKEGVKKILDKGEAATVKDVEDLVENGVVKAKVASRQDIETMKDQHPVALVKFVANCVFRNDCKGANRLNPIAAQLNDAIGAILKTADINLL